MATIQILELASGGKTPFDGQYVKEYDPSRDGVEPGTGRWMRCHLVTTPNRDEALQLSVEEAWELWRTVDKRDPHGGRFTPGSGLNRPLTAFTVTIA